MGSGIDEEGVIRSNCMCTIVMREAAAVNKQAIKHAVASTLNTNAFHPRFCSPIYIYPRFLEPLLMECGKAIICVFASSFRHL